MMRIYLILLSIFVFQGHKTYGLYLVENSDVVQSLDSSKAVERAYQDVCQVALYRHDKILRRGNGILVLPQAVLTLTPNLEGYERKYPYELKVSTQSIEIPVRKIVTFADSNPTFALLLLKDPLQGSRDDRLDGDVTMGIPRTPALVSWGSLHRVSVQKSLALWTRQNYVDYWNNIVLRKGLKRRLHFPDKTHDFELRGPVLSIKSSSCGLEESNVGAPLFNVRNQLIGLALPAEELIESDLYINARTAIAESIIRNYSTLVFSTIGAALTVGLSVNQVDLKTFVQAELISYIALEMLSKMITYATQFTTLDELAVSPYHFACYLREKEAEDAAILNALKAGKKFVNPFLRITPDVVAWINGTVYADDD